MRVRMPVPGPSPTFRSHPGHRVPAADGLPRSLPRRHHRRRHLATGEVPCLKLNKFLKNKLCAY